MALPQLKYNEWMTPRASSARRLLGFLIRSLSAKPSIASTVFTLLIGLLTPALLLISLRLIVFCSYINIVQSSLLDITIHTIMRAFITLSAALFASLASASSTANAFKNPPGGYVFTAGESTTLSWNADSGTTVTLRLQHGETSTANSGIIIACEYPKPPHISFLITSIHLDG